MRWRVRAGYPVAVFFVVLARPTLTALAVGAAVSLVGLSVRGYAAGYLRKDRELATSGPYAHTRNPLYLGSAVLAAGFVIAGHSLWSAALATAYFAVFYYAVMRAEEEGLRQRFGAPFGEYAARVPLFFPSLRAKMLQSGDGGFSWEQYLRNREYQALIGTLLGIGVMFARMVLHARLGF